MMDDKASRMAVGLFEITKLLVQQQDIKKQSEHRDIVSM